MPDWLRRRSAAYWLSFVTFAAYFAAFTVQYAVVFDAFVDGASRWSRVFQATIIAVFIAIGLAQARAEAVIGIAAVTALAGYHVVFTIQSGIPPNFNTLFGYVGLFAFVPVALCGVPLQHQLRLMFGIALAYVVFYVAANGLLVSLSHKLHDTPGGLIDSGDERGVRVMIAALSASFVAFYAVEDGAMNPLLRVSSVAVALASIWLSGSRVFSILFAFMFAVRLLRLNMRWMMVGLSAAFLGVCALHLYGLIDRDWNPYEYVFTDKSGRGRYLEYPQAIAAIKRYPLLGVGIEPDSTAMGEFLKVPRRWGSVFWGDLGAIGPLGQFGVPGLLLFLFASVASLLSASLKSGDPGLDALRVNCALSAVYGVIAPTVLWPPHAFYTAMLFGAWLRHRHMGSSNDVDPTPAGAADLQAWRAAS